MPSKCWLHWLRYPVVFLSCDEDRVQWKSRHRPYNPPPPTHGGLQATWTLSPCHKGLRSLQMARAGSKIQTFVQPWFTPPRQKHSICSRSPHYTHSKALSYDGKSISISTAHVIVTRFCVIVQRCVRRQSLKGPEDAALHSPKFAAFS
jgi:hypothetical protein